LQASQVAVPGSEIIHRDGDSPVLEGVENGCNASGLLGQNALAYIQFQGAGLQAGGAEDGEQTLKKVRAAQLDFGDIDGHRPGRQTRVGPCLALRACLLEDPCTEGKNQAGFLGNGNELRRRHRSKRGMRPAQKRFRPDDRTRLEVDLGLVLQRDFIPFQGVPQTLFQGLTGAGDDIHLRLEESVGVTAVLLGQVHGRVRVLDQGFRILPIAGIDADANASCHVNSMAVDAMHLSHRLQ
jgi:hypothetical protein